jgi:N-acetylglucosaminyl-diphospho-decaprenol L-rhamnosyltransferase
MNFNQITVGIVTFKSEKVIFDCLKSIKKIKNIIIFDNSHDHILKKKVKKKYPNVQFILSKKNLGYGAANNQIIKKSKKKYVFLISPDVILKKNCENNLLKSVTKLRGDFSILSPVSKIRNYGYFKKKDFSESTKILEVDYVNGFALLLYRSKIKKIGMFDEQIFLYNEEIDLCKRLRLAKQKIFIDKSSEVIHHGAKSSNIGFEFEKCRNWHWMWSQVYFKKKYNNKFLVNLEFSLLLVLQILKILFYTLKFDKKEMISKTMRYLGTLNALTGKKSWYRPKFDLN